MPPSKGAPLVSKAHQKKLPFKTIKHAPVHPKPGKELTTVKGKKGKKSLAGGKPQDEALLKLRIPADLCKMLPSVKKFNGKKAKLVKEFAIKEEKEERPVPQALLGIKRRRGETQNYHLKLLKEEKLSGMIWDLAITDDERLVVCTSEGAFLSDAELESPQKLDNVILPGGVGFLRDGTIVLACRFMDTVNLFSRDGKFLRAFDAGPSPQALAVNNRDQILVTDTGTRSVRVYGRDGRQAGCIADCGKGYEFKWPLYISINSTQHILVSDSHLQQVLVFDPNLRYKGEFPLKTQGGNQVIKPHGLCTNNDDVFIIDRSIDSMEVFRPDGTYLQTLLPSEEGSVLRPKVVRTSNDGSRCVIGGITGLVRVYEFVADTEIPSPVYIKKEKPDRMDMDDVIVLD